MLDELLSFVFSTIYRFFSYLLMDIILDVLIKGAGYLLIKALPFSKKKTISPDGFLSITLGLIFWVSIGMMIYWLYSYL